MPESGTPPNQPSLPGKGVARAMLEAITVTTQKDSGEKTTESIFISMDRTLSSILAALEHKGKGGGGGADNDGVDVKGLSDAETLMEKIAKSAKDYKDSLSESEKSLEKIGAQAENIHREALRFLGIYGGLISLSEVGQTFRKLSEYSGNMATQFQMAAQAASRSFNQVADAAAHAGESIEHGARALDAMREAGVRSAAELNKSLKTVASASLMIGGEMSSWASSLGEVTYNLQFSSKQVQGLVRQTATLQRQFALTADETKKILGDTKEIMSTMQRLGTATASAAAEMNRLLAASQALRAGDTIKRATEGLTSFQKFNEASAETQNFMLRLVGRQNITAFEVMSGQLLASQEGMQRYQKAAAATSADILRQAQGMNKISQQVFIKSMTGIEGGIEELRRTVRGYEVASMSLEEARAKANKALEKGTEAEVRAHLEYHLGQRFDGTISDMRAATEKYLKARELEETISKSTEANDLLNNILQAQAAGPQEFRRVVGNMSKQHQGLLADIKKSTGKNLEELQSGEMLKVLGQHADLLQKSADTAEKQLEEQRLISDPIKRLTQAIMGPINKILSRIAGVLATIFEAIGPLGTEIIAWLIIIGAAVLALKAMGVKSAMLSKGVGAVKGGIGAVKGALGFGGGGGPAAAAPPPVPTVTGTPPAPGPIEKLVNGLNKISIKSIGKAALIMAAVTVLFYALGPAVKALNDATRGMDTVAFVTVITSLIAITGALYAFSKVADKIELGKLLKGVGVLAIGILALAALGLVIRLTLAPAFRGIDAGTLASQMVAMVPLVIAVGLLMGALTIIGIVAMALLKSKVGIVALAAGLVAFGILIVALSLLAWPLGMFQDAFSGIDVNALALNFVSLVVIFGAITLLGLAMVGLAVAIPLMLSMQPLLPLLALALVAMVVVIVALALLAGPLAAFGAAMSGVDAMSIGKQMTGIAMIFAGVAIIAYALMAVGGAALKILMGVGLGVLVVIVLLGALALLAGSLHVFGQAIAPVDFELAKTGVEGLSSVLWSLVKMAPALIAVGVMGNLGTALMAPAIAMIMSSILLAKPLELFVQAFSGVPLKEAEKQVESTASIIGSMSSMAKAAGVGFFGGSSLVKGIRACVTALYNMIPMGHPLKSVSNSFPPATDLKNLAASVEAIGSIMSSFKGIQELFPKPKGWFQLLNGIYSANSFLRELVKVDLASPLEDLIMDFENIKPREVRNIRRIMTAVGEIAEAIAVAGSVFGNPILNAFKEVFGGGIRGHILSIVTLLRQLSKSSFAEAVLAVKTAFSSVSEAAAKEVGEKVGVISRMIGHVASLSMESEKIFKKRWILPNRNRIKPIIVTLEMMSGEAFSKAINDFIKSDFMKLGEQTGLPRQARTVRRLMEAITGIMGAIANVEFEKVVGRSWIFWKKTKGLDESVVEMTRATNALSSPLLWSGVAKLVKETADLGELNLDPAGKAFEAIGAFLGVVSRVLKENPMEINRGMGGGIAGFFSYLWGGGEKEEVADSMGPLVKTLDSLSTQVFPAIERLVKSIKFNESDLEKIAPTFEAINIALNSMAILGEAVATFSKRATWTWGDGDSVLDKALPTLRQLGPIFSQLGQFLSSVQINESLVKGIEPSFEALGVIFSAISGLSVMMEGLTKRSYWKRSYCRMQEAMSSLACLARSLKSTVKDFSGLENTVGPAVEALEPLEKLFGVLYTMGQQLTRFNERVEGTGIFVDDKLIKVMKDMLEGFAKAKIADNLKTFTKPFTPALMLSTEIAMMTLGSTVTALRSLRSITRLSESLGQKPGEAATKLFKNLSNSGMAAALNNFIAGFTFKVSQVEAIAFSLDLIVTLVHFVDKVTKIMQNAADNNIFRPFTLFSEQLAASNVGYNISKFVKSFGDISSSLIQGCFENIVTLYEAMSTLSDTELASLHSKIGTMAAIAGTIEGIHNGSSASTVEGAVHHTGDDILIDIDGAKESIDLLTVNQQMLGELMAIKSSLQGIASNGLSIRAGNLDSPETEHPPFRALTTSSTDQYRGSRSLWNAVRGD